MAEIVWDIESYSNVFLVGMKRLSDGKTLIMEQSHRSKIDTRHLRSILLKNTMIGFNSMGYDAPVTWRFLDTESVAEAKIATNKIILGGVRYWHAEEAVGTEIPYDFKHRAIDMIEPQPNPFASLKVLHARLHGEELRDLPYEPEEVLSDEQIDNLRIYLERSDLPATEKLWNALSEGMELRRAIGGMIGQNVMSKSDTQMGLAIIKKRAEAITGKKIEKSGVKAGHTFRYRVPDYIHFVTPRLQEMLASIKAHSFVVDVEGKVELPAFLAHPVTIGCTEYAMGIGGLHSTESNRAVRSDWDHVLCDFDVASYYPAIILTLGLYPDAVGPAFLKVYEGIRQDRLKAKKEKNKAVDKAMKIALNGTFGSLGSRFSFVYAPELMIAVTLTGQLALLMLIERAEQRGIPAVSGNTDGVVFHVPRSKFAGWVKDDSGKDTIRPAPSPLADLIEEWELDTGFDMEGTEYKALYSQSVNSYFAIKADGGHKRKGPLGNPWSDDPNDRDPRAALMKNPQMTILSDAALAQIKDGVPIRKTIMECKDIRQFVTVIKVTKGATWAPEFRTEKITVPEKMMYDGVLLPEWESELPQPSGAKYLGKVIRYYWSTRGAPIFESKPNPKTGNFKKVSKTEGASECMTLPGCLPDDIDYDRYIAETEKVLKELGYFGEVLPPEKRIRITKENRNRLEPVWALLL